MDRIKINQLRVKGIRKDYVVNFRPGLNIISGEISTGKTSILELIDYCLGNHDHPKYPELAINGINALLEIEIDSEIYTIARQLFTNRQKAGVHFCTIADLRTKHESIEVTASQKKGESSISSFLLSKLKLGAIPLKEAPSQDITDVDTMSFRDIMWFCFLERERVGGKNLVFEKDFMKRIKMVQVFDVIFDLHSKRIAFLSAEADRIENEIGEKELNEKAILNFVDAQGIPTVAELKNSKNQLYEEIRNKEIRLQEIDQKIAGSSEIAKELQDKVLKARSEVEGIRVQKRDNEKTLLRLIPLRADYNEEIRKLTFLQQAKKLFDPLTVIFCPVCMSSLEEMRNDQNQRFCPLCKKNLMENKAEEVIDVSGEIRSNERRLGELAKYVASLEQKISELEKQDKEFSQKLSSASQELDATLRTFVSPYLTERENIVSTISTNKNEIKHIDDNIRNREIIEEITQSILKLQSELRQIENVIEEERKKSTNRIELINSLSATFFTQLRKVGFPKLEIPTEAWIDEKLNPFVRVLLYSDLSSEGAINLSSICWLTSIYYEAIKRLMHHPGFLMIDSVQSGIGLGNNVASDFRDQAIVDGLYKLLQEMATLDNRCQIIVVDNHPPQNMAKDVIVYYSGKKNIPPYGFIDDETG
jgi:hypothetical protein